MLKSGKKMTNINKKKLYKTPNFELRTFQSTFT